MLALYNPMEFAEAWAAIDQLSGGRAIVAVGAGYNADYVRAFGLKKDRMRARFVEAAEVVRTAWPPSDAWSFEGEFFSYEQVRLLPGPFRTGGPPLWVAGQGPLALKYAAATGDGFAGDPFPITAEAWNERVAMVRQGAAQRGAPSPDVVLLRHCFLTDDDEEADAVLEEVCLPQFRFYEQAGLLKDRLPAGRTVDLALAREATFVGNASSCTERLTDLVRRYDVTYVILKILRPAQLSPLSELRMVASLGHEVVPAVRRAA